VTEAAFGRTSSNDAYFCLHTADRKSNGILHCKSAFKDLPKMLLCLEDNCSPFEFFPYSKVESGGNPALKYDTEVTGAAAPLVTTVATAAVGTATVALAVGEAAAEKLSATPAVAEKSSVSPAAATKLSVSPAAAPAVAEKSSVSPAAATKLSVSPAAAEEYLEEDSKPAARDSNCADVLGRFSFLVNGGSMKGKNKIIPELNCGDCLVFLGDMGHCVKSQMAAKKYIYFDTNVVDDRSVLKDDYPPTIDVDWYCTILGFNNKNRVYSLFKSLNMMDANPETVKEFGDSFYPERPDGVDDDDFSLGEEVEKNLVIEAGKNFPKAYKMYCNNLKKNKPRTITLTF
jgi:hypothetical protein